MVIYSLLDEYWIAASVYQRSDLTHEEQITPVHNSEMSYGPEEICMEEISSANVEMQRKIDKLQVKRRVAFKGLYFVWKIYVIMMTW